MAARWYFQIEGEQYGPVADRGLKKLASRGEIDRATLVRKVGTTQWVTAGTLRGLFAPAKPKRQVVNPQKSAKDGVIWSCRLIFLACSLLLYGISLDAPAFNISSLMSNPVAEWWKGSACLMLGWMGVIVLHFAWFANPLLAFGWAALACNNLSIARNCGVAAIFFSFQMLVLSPLSHLGMGYYLWNLSMLLVIIGAVVCRRVEAKQADQS